MKNKILNIIGVVAVILAAAFAIKGQRNMKNTLGYFPSAALENAPARVNKAIDAARARVDELAATPDKTYMNFVRPLMDSDAALDDVLTPIYHLDAVMHSDETKEIMNEILPVLSAFSTDMIQHKGIYEGFKHIKKHEYDSLDTAQKKLVDDAIRAFEVSGINLPEKEQARLKEIGIELSKLSNDFSNNVIAANKNFKLKITDEKQLGEMPESDRAAAKVENGWEFSLLDPFYGPFMIYVTDRDLRKEMHRARFARAPENADLIPRFLVLRAEMAKILGYENYAQLVFENRSAPSPAAAKEFLTRLSARAKSSAEQDKKQLSDRAAKDGVKDFSPSDAAFYARLVQQEQYDLDESLVREYFELNATTDRVFDMLAEIFGADFVRRKEKLWHPDAKYYDVIQDGKIIAGFYVDLTTRETKSPGAWKMGYKSRRKDASGKLHLPEVFVVANFPAAAKNTPSLMTPKDVATLFHEMGHALHGLLTKVDERDLSGTSVDRDVVEFPSSFLEYFWNSPAVLKRIARHYKTDDFMPDDLIEKIIRSDRFLKGTELLWKTEYSLFDLDMHMRRGMTAEEVKKAFNKALPAAAITPGPAYDRPHTAFLHPFAHAYAAGYYSYLWAEQLAADAYEAFKGNPFDTELAHKYRDTVLAQGGTKKMDAIYREFMGRDPKPESLLNFLGLK